MRLGLPQSLFGRLLAGLLVAVGLTLIVIVVLIVRERRDLALWRSGAWSAASTIAEASIDLTELDSEAPKVVRRPDGSIDVDGSVLVDRATKRLGLHMQADAGRVDTLGGWVLTHLGRPPHPGDVVTVDGHEIEVLEVDDMRIRRLRVRPIQS